MIMIALVSLWVRTYYFIPRQNRWIITTIVFFMAGALSYYLYEYIKNLSLTKWIGYGLLILVSCFICLQPFKASLPFIGVVNNQQQLLFFTVICLSTPLIFNSIRHSRIDRFIGDLSYPIYVTHMFCIMAPLWLFPYYGALGWSSSATIMVLTMIIALLLHFIVEKPIEYYRNYRKKIKKYSRQEVVDEENSQIEGAKI